MSVINLGRTTKGNIVFYSSDGMGRDGYITYNDGGFWKDKYIKSKIYIIKKGSEFFVLYFIKQLHFIIIVMEVVVILIY